VIPIPFRWCNQRQLHTFRNLTRDFNEHLIPGSLTAIFGTQRDFRNFQTDSGRYLFQNVGRGN
jgi:hypothetical protein